MIYKQLHKTGQKSTVLWTLPEAKSSSMEGKLSRGITCKWFLGREAWKECKTINIGTLQKMKASELGCSVCLFYDMCLPEINWVCFLEGKRVGCGRLENILGRNSQTSMCPRGLMIAPSLTPSFWIWIAACLVSTHVWLTPFISHPPTARQTCCKWLVRDSRVCVCRSAWSPHLWGIVQYIRVSEIQRVWFALPENLFQMTWIFWSSNQYRKYATRTSK